MGGLCYCRESHLQLKHEILTEIHCFIVSQHFLIRLLFLKHNINDGLLWTSYSEDLIVIEIDVQGPKEFRI